MPNRFARGNRDANEPLITEVIRRYNIRYGLLPEKFGADILLYVSPMALVEVKNPAYKWKLTQGEQETQEYCQMMGIPYHVVETPEEMIAICAEG